MYYEDSAIRRMMMVGFALRNRSHSPLDQTQNAVRLLTLHSVMFYLQIYL